MHAAKILGRQAVPRHLATAVPMAGMQEHIFAIAVAAAFGLLPYAVRDMPHWMAKAGVAAGIMMAIITFLPVNQKYIWPILLIVLGLLVASYGVVWSIQRYSMDDVVSTDHINPPRDEKKELIKSVIQYTRINRIDEVIDELALNIRVQMERQNHLAIDPSIPFNYSQFGNQVIFRAREGNWGGRVITPGASLNALGAHEYPNEVSFVVRTPKMSQDGAQLKAFSDNILLPSSVKWDLDEYIRTWAQSEEAIADVLNDQAQKGHLFVPQDIDALQQELSRRLKSLDGPAEKLANDARQYM